MSTLRKQCMFLCCLRFRRQECWSTSQNVSSISNLSRTWHSVCLHPVRSSIEHAWVDLPDIVLIHILQMVLAMAWFNFMVRAKEIITTHIPDLACWIELPVRSAVNEISAATNVNQCPFFSAFSSLHPIDNGSRDVWVK